MKMGALSDVGSTDFEFVAADFDFESVEGDEESGVDGVGGVAVEERLDRRDLGRDKATRASIGHRAIAGVHRLKLRNMISKRSDR